MLKGDLVLQPGRGPFPNLPKNKRENFETPVVSVEKNVPWQGERGSARKSHGALQAALLEAALWHMWEMLVVLALAPALSQALAGSRAQGAFPNPAATALALSRAGKNHSRAGTAPARSCSLLPSAEAGGRKQGRGSALQQQELQVRGRADVGCGQERQGNRAHTMGTRPWLSILFINYVLSHNAGNISCAEFFLFPDTKRVFQIISVEKHQVVPGSKHSEPHLQPKLTP